MWWFSLSNDFHLKWSGRNPSQAWEFATAVPFLLWLLSCAAASSKLQNQIPRWHASLFFPMLCVLWMSSPTHLWQLSCSCCDSIVRSPWASSCVCWTLPAFPASLISVLSTAEVSPVWAEGRDHLPWSAGDAPPNVLHLSLLNLVRDLLAFWDPSGCQHSPLVPTTGALKCQHWRNLPYCSPSN